MQIMGQNVDLTNQFLSSSGRQLVMATHTQLFARTRAAEQEARNRLDHRLGDTGRTFTEAHLEPEGRSAHLASIYGSKEIW